MKPEKETGEQIWVRKEYIRLTFYDSKWKYGNSPKCTLTVEKQRYEQVTLATDTNPNSSHNYLIAVMEQVEGAKQFPTMMRLRQSGREWKLEEKSKIMPNEDDERAVNCYILPPDIQGLP